MASSLAVELEVLPVASWDVVAMSATTTAVAGRKTMVTLVCDVRGDRVVDQCDGLTSAEAALVTIRRIVPSRMNIEKFEVQMVGSRVQARIVAARNNVSVIGTSRNTDPALAIAKAYLHALLQLDKGPRLP